jgi:hypothetical protein
MITCWTKLTTNRVSGFTHVIEATKRLVSQYMQALYSLICRGRGSGKGKQLQTYVVGEKVVKDQGHKQLFIKFLSKHGPCLNGCQVGNLVLCDIVFSPWDYLHDEHIRTPILDQRWQ